MALPRTPQQIYINRDIDFIIEETIKEETPKLLFVHGNGGVGKSTLLKKFLSYEAKAIPTVLINMQENSSQSFVDMLLDEEITTVKHCSHFESMRDILHQNPKILNTIVNFDSDGIEKGVNEYVDEDIGEYVKVFVDLFKMGAKWKQKDLEAKKKEFLNNPEYVLLSALAEDFKEYGLFMVDTFEKIKNSNIKSKITFLESGEISMSLKEKNYRLKDYVERLVYLLVDSSTFIIAGRNSQDELNMEVPLDYTDELSLENFSVANITELFKLHVKKDTKLSMPSDKRIEQIAELTNGNPLLVGLFPKIAREYESWDKLDYAEMERRIKTDKKNGLLFYMTDRVLTHLKESKDIWKLVIPRILNYEIEKLLFKDSEILEKLIDVGLAYNGLNKDSERYYLHDDVHRAIVAYYEREFKGEFSSWHDYEKVAELHRELMEFYEKHCELHGVNSGFEGCYHKMMLRERFEREFEVFREEFISLALGSISLNHNEKFRICKDFDTLSNLRISELIKFWKDEIKIFSEFMSQKLYARILKDESSGIKEQLIKNISYFKSLLKEELFKNDWTIYYVLGELYSDNQEYNEMITSYEKLIEINQKQYNPFYNLGNAYSKIGDFDKALSCYSKAIEINPHRYEAYFNTGSVYLHQENYDEAITSYRKSLVIKKEDEEAYFSMSSAYFYKKEYKKAIEILQKAIIINPKNYDSFNNMGVLYLHLNEFKKAINSYIQSIQINSNNSLAYLNLFTLQLTKNQPFDLEAKYIEIFQYQKDKFLKYEMLKILQDIVQNQEVNIEEWVQKYHDVVLSDWRFDELHQWIDGIEDEVLKVKLREVLEVFEGHDVKEKENKD